MAIACTVCRIETYTQPGAHEGRRPEGASNGGSMCSAECTLCPNTADRKNTTP